VDGTGCPIQVSVKETEMIETGMIRLQNINFETGKAIIKDDSYATLDDIGNILTHWPQLRIEVGGHTDSMGSDALNQRLSWARAKAVLDYLTNNPAARAGPVHDGRIRRDAAGRIEQDRARPGQEPPRRVQGVEQGSVEEADREAGVRTEVRSRLRRVGDGRRGEGSNPGRCGVGRGRSTRPARPSPTGLGTRGPAAPRVRPSAQLKVRGFGGR
jgi:hypothetical protein